MPEEDTTETEQERDLWDINAADTKVELSDGKVEMAERAIHTGRIRVAKALETDHTPDHTWLYVTAESRDGADITLTEQQTRELRDALDACLEDADA